MVVEDLVTVNVEVKIKDKAVKKANVLLFRNHDTYNALTNLNGIARLSVPVGVYDLKIDYEGYISDTDTITVKSSILNDFSISLSEVDECNNKKSDIKITCKHFHQEPYWTPNNYDLHFDYNNIPSNILLESQDDLRKRLQKKLPLSKILHLQLESKSVPCNNEIKCYTKTYIKFKKKRNDKTINFVGELK